MVLCHRRGWLSVLFKVTAPDFPAVFPNGAGRQAGHGQAALPFPDHSGWIIHHHRHLPPPQGGDGAAAGGRPDLPVLKRRGSPQVRILFLFTHSRMESSVSGAITHHYLDSFNLVFRRRECICVYASTVEDVTHGSATRFLQRSYWMKWSQLYLFFCVVYLCVLLLIFLKAELFFTVLYDLVNTAAV